MSTLTSGPQPVQFIDTAAALESCIQKLEAAPSIAFDLEFDNNLRNYGVTLCLIQIATPDNCYVIDPLAGLDMHRLYALFENTQIEKIVHSPGEDLRLLHSLGCYPKNLFDVQVVAILLDYEHISLAALLAEKMQLTLSKGQQRSDWRARPLTPAQLDYAAADVLWLHQLKQLLLQEASLKGLLPFIQEEQAALSATIYKPEVRKSFLKQSDTYRLSPYDQYVLNALFRYRDTYAHKINKPPFQVMDEPTLRGLADGSIQPNALAATKGVHGSLKSNSALKELTEALHTMHEEAQALSLATILPKRKYLTAEEQAAREKSSRDKVEKFAPIQESLARLYGINAARFMLSNGMVNDLLTFTLSIRDLRAYRQELINGIAQQQGIDLSDYE